MKKTTNTTITKKPAPKPAPLTLATSAPERRKATADAKPAPIAAKPAKPAGLVKVACSKCGRENNRPAGSTNGDCRVASACQARRRRAAEAAKPMAAKPAKGRAA